MVSIRALHKTIVLLCVCILYNSMRADSKPLSRRAISEVQLMHSIGLRKHIQQRQDWLQEHMQDIHTAPRHYGKMSSERVVLEHLLSKDFPSDTENGDLVESLDTQ